MNQATIARFEDGSPWPRRREELRMAYASELGIGMCGCSGSWTWFLWIENERVLDEGSRDDVREALGRLAPPEPG